ncbi:hypothetical protein L7F22_030815 [Adiantum nelumboides]|nr:hypothetical protein [Adiantum nelumboides]
MEEWHAVCKYYGTQMQLVFLSSRTHGVSLMSYVMEISTAHQTFQLQKVGSQQNTSSKIHDSEQSEQNSQFSSTPALDYLFHVFDKYAFLTARNTHEIRLGGWMQKLLCLVPLQIARAESNTLKPMINGLQIPSDANFSDAVSLASLLRFGPYDIILAGWKRDVKIISSMGKQSSGKSYLLNHLSGSLLDVAGGRCTDGVWMTVRCEPDCLYVLLDFEGLGSFERSEQENMFLSILNAAISNITIFNKKVS